MAQMPAGFANPALNAPHPPYIDFKKEAVERRDAGGNVIYVDVNMAYITPPGGKDTVVKVADEWFPYIKKAAKDGQYPQLWYNEFFAMYNAWKAGEEAPVSGTHVKNWPSASPAEIKILMDLKINTVELCAEMNEEAMQRIGMGSRSLKQRAVDFLSAQSGPAVIVAKLDAMQAQLNNLQVLVSQKDETIKGLEARLMAHGAPIGQFDPQPQPRMRPVEDRLDQARANVERNETSDDDVVKDALLEVLD